MNIIEITERFPTEVDAVMHFERARWGKKPRCAYCDSLKLRDRSTDLRFKCLECDRSSFVTVGTVLQGTRIDLKTWLFAFAIVSDAKKGLSAKQLQRNLGVSYPTAWAMYHKIRDMMAVENNEMEPLDDVVEMDETFVGGKPRRANIVRMDESQREGMAEQVRDAKRAGYDLSPLRGNPAKPAVDVKRGRGTKKTPVVGIVQRDGTVIAQVMRTLSQENLRAMVKRHVDTDEALLITDSYSGYSKLDRIIDHIKIDHQKAYSYDGVNTNTIESFWAIIKRGIIGQYHQVSRKHLPRYVSEFVFKYNNRHDDDMFETLVQNAVRPTS